MTVVVFDWDGTLVDSMKALSGSFVDIASEYFGVRKEEAAQIMQMHLGQDLTAHMARIAASKNPMFSAAMVEKAIKKYRESEAKSDAKSKLFPEVLKVISELKRDGYELCVSSGRPQNSILAGVKGKGMTPCFRFILGTKSEFHKGKAHFDFISKALTATAKQLVFVGDGPFDMKVGKEYGCLTVGRIDQVDEATLLSAGADAIIYDLWQLPRIIREYENKQAIG